MADGSQRGCTHHQPIDDAESSVKLAITYRPLIVRWLCAPPARTVLALVVLAAIIGIVYSPALNRMFYADQIVYMADMEGSTSIFKHYDYSTSRRYFKGDEVLYRPLLFITLATELRFFDYKYRAWNFANLCFHFLVAAMLYGVLRKIQPTYFALLFAMLFAVMRPNFGLVTWNHLGGYLLAFAFVMLCWLVGLRLLRSAAKPARWWWVIYLFSGLISLLFYECAFPFYLACCVYLLVSLNLRDHRLPIREALLMSLPVLVYGVLYWSHWQNAHDLTASSFFNHTHMRQFPLSLLSRIYYWATITLVPGMLVHQGELLELFVPSARPLLNLLTASLLTILVALASAGALRWNQIRSKLPLIGAVLFALLGYSSIIVFGRPNDRPWYPYGFCLGSVLLAHSCLDFAALSRPCRWLATGALFGIIAIHGSLSYNLSKDIHQANAIVGGCYDQIASFIEQHKAEPDFSFAVELPRKLDPPISLREGYGNVSRVMKKSQIIFYRYYNADRPKYILQWSQRMTEISCGPWSFLAIDRPTMPTETDPIAP